MVVLETAGAVVIEGAFSAKNLVAKTKADKNLFAKKSSSTKRKVADSANSPSDSLPAKEDQILIVSTTLKSFTITYSRAGIAIKGHKLDLSLQRSQCNAHIIDRFNEEISELTKELIKKNILKRNKNKALENISVQVGEEKYFVDSRLEAGKLFLSFPREFLRMKWEEKFNCEAKKNQ